ncbi:hypothetical protein N5915_04230 [Arcobacter lacus]|uniref:hypothetical protein n=1 Tax=Arcobacter lacus TaxID=1912876 RepID=UPI0021BB6319|nr:hypothetical protein [Arcobacter lacus]MCT7908758.1 hypothetical protein [Arcobacter lacus]
MKAVIQRTSDLKISKELIYEVLNIPKENIVDIYIDGKYLLIKKDNNRIEEHNIYEFAFKCKEWAYTKCNYTLESTSNPFGGFCKIKIYEIDIGKAYNKPDDVYRGANEVEAIVKACIWILENKDNR